MSKKNYYPITVGSLHEVIVCVIIIRLNHKPVGKALATTTKWTGKEKVRKRFFSCTEWLQCNPCAHWTRSNQDYYFIAVTNIIFTLCKRQYSLWLCHFDKVYLFNKRSNLSCSRALTLCVCVCVWWCFHFPVFIFSHSPPSFSSVFCLLSLAGNW